MDTVKGIFPYSFVNKDNLNYVGITPSIYHYPDKTDLNLNKYLEFFKDKENYLNIYNELLSYQNKQVKDKVVGTVINKEFIDLSKNFSELTNNFLNKSDIIN